MEITMQRSTYRIFTRDSNIESIHQRHFLFSRAEDIRATVDIGFFCINGSSLVDLLEKSKHSLDQKFEDWYFAHDELKRSYVPYFWSYLSITDRGSLSEAKQALDARFTLFIDRDGVLIGSRSRSKYIDNVNDMIFNDDLLDGLRHNKDKIRHISIVTNQAWAGPFLAIYKYQASYVEEYLRANCGIASVSTHTCCHSIEERCNCRKPKPGLFLQLINMSKHPILPSRSRFIGDSSSDIGAARHMMLEYLDVNNADAGTLSSWFQL
jgi:D-glycero-D-manno-heptose 1,7-bisphosphate phosphatase